MKDYKASEPLTNKILQELNIFMMTIICGIISRMFTSNSSSIGVNIDLILLICGLYGGDLLARVVSLKKRYANKRRIDYRNIRIGIFVGIYMVGIILDSHFSFQNLFYINGKSSIIILFLVWGIISKIIT